jgi:hypothetical protein
MPRPGSALRAGDFEHPKALPMGSLWPVSTCRARLFCLAGGGALSDAQRIQATLDFCASIPAAKSCSIIPTAENYPLEQRKLVMALVERVAALGEPFRSYFDRRDGALLRNNAKRSRIGARDAFEFPPAAEYVRRRVGRRPSCNRALQAQAVATARLSLVFEDEGSSPAFRSTERRAFMEMRSL